MDGATRQAHAELHGQAWRHDDPIWDAIYPPNGFNCRCRVQALAEEEAERRGAKPNPPGPRPRSAESRPVADMPEGATGELPARPVKRVWWTDRDGARRSFSPDAGWGYNPGAHGPEIARTGAARRATPAPWQPTWRDYGERLKHAKDLPRAKPPKLLDAAGATAAAAAQIAGELGMGESGRLRIDTPFRPVEIRMRGVQHVAQDRQGRRERRANRILPTLQDPDEVWLTLYAVAGEGGRPDRPEVRTHYLKVWDDGGSFSVAAEDHAGGLFWTWFPADWGALNARRRGILAYAKEDE